MAHQRAGERLCGWCAEAEGLARLRAEAFPSQPSPPGSEYLAPVTERQASINRADLSRALDGTDWEPEAEPEPRRPLRVVKGAGTPLDGAA